MGHSQTIAKKSTYRHHKRCRCWASSGCVLNKIGKCSCVQCPIATCEAAPHQAPDNQDEKKCLYSKKRSIYWCSASCIILVQRIIRSPTLFSIVYRAICSLQCNESLALFEIYNCLWKQSNFQVELFDSRCRSSFSARLLLLWLRICKLSTDVERAEYHMRHENEFLLYKKVLSGWERVFFLQKR